MSKKFDLSENDAIFLIVDKMQEKDRMADVLENNYKAVYFLCGKMEKLETKFSEILYEWDGLFRPCAVQPRSI